MTIISSIALLSLMLAAFDGAKELPITVPTEAQVGDLVDLEPGTYEANKVEYDADCGTLVVLENRADPNSRLIALPVIRVRATGGNPTEPIFYFAGGLGKPTLPSIPVSRWTSMRDLAGPGWPSSWSPLWYWFPSCCRCRPGGSSVGRSGEEPARSRPTDARLRRGLSSRASRQPGRVETRDKSRIASRGRAHTYLLGAFLALGCVSGLA
jgi:hypothetical protein